MRQVRKWWIVIGEKFWQRLNCKTRRIWQFIFVVLLLCLTVRSLPYFAPIRATDIIQDRLAVEFSDRNGLPLGTLLTRDQDHTAVVPLNQVSPQFIQAILAAEDAGFYQHGALDLKAIFRSIKIAIDAKKIVSGASTITMQLARMLDPSPRNLSGKLREIWLSWRLVAGMNKDEILSAYINRLPMGGNIYGIEAAARTYFLIPAADLNVAQASLLAAIPNNPTYFNPYTHWERLKQRQAYVLNRMTRDGYITQSQADLAYKEKLSLQSRSPGIIAAPHFLFWVASQLPKQHSAQICTTINRPLQQFVEAQVQQVIRSLRDRNVHDAAALVIDNHTGEVLAYVGSPDYFNEAQLGRNDGVQALRQPGSTLKPFLYELALEKGAIRPHTILADVPTYYAIPGAKLYSPVDYNETFLGPVLVRIALANSLNVPAVRVLEKVGVPTFLDRLRQLGFENLNQSPEHYGLGLALGSGEVSLWELAKAYLTLARQGQVTPILTQLTENKFPLICVHLCASVDKNNQIEFASTWALITDILSDRHARATAFGVDSVLALPFPSAVKTGTSSNFRDTWTVGFTTDYTVATWVGNFNGDRMGQVSGVTGAAPLWNRIMLHLHEGQEPAAFPHPEGLVQKAICATSGRRPTPECTSVVQEFFYPEDVAEYYQISGANAVNLRPEYDEWQARQHQSSSTAKILKILSPHNGDLFVVYPEPDKPKLQRLEFKLAAPAMTPVEWWLNGQRLAAQSANSFFWAMSPGAWTLEVKCGEQGDRVNFQVQLASDRKQGGFSIAQP